MTIADSIPETSCRLDRVRPGRRFAVLGIEGEDDLARRLSSAGLWEGAEVELVGAAPFGDPILVEVHGFRLALRRSEAGRVRVRPLEPEA